MPRLTLALGATLLACVPWLGHAAPLALNEVIKPPAVDAQYKPRAFGYRADADDRYIALSDVERGGSTVFIYSTKDFSLVRTIEVGDLFRGPRSAQTFDLEIRGNRLAIAGINSTFDGDDRSAVGVFNLRNGRLVKRIAPPRPGEVVRSVSFADGGLILGSSSEDGRGETLFHVFDRRLRLQSSFGGPAVSNFLTEVEHEDGRLFVSDYGASAPGIEFSGGSGKVFVLDVASGQVEREIASPFAGLGYFGWDIAAEGGRLAVGSMLGAGVYDAATGDLISTLLPTETASPRTGSFFGSSIDLRGDTVAVGAMYGSLASPNMGGAYLFDAVSGEVLQTFGNPTPDVRYPRSNPDLFGENVELIRSGLLVTASLDDTPFAKDVGTAYFYGRGPAIEAAEPGLAPVPLPASAWLLLGGALGLLLLRRQRA